MSKSKNYQIRVGCDVVQISRFQKILGRTPKVSERVFLPAESENASVEKLAGVFAAKEAVMKALSLPVGSWQRIEIRKAKSGRPQAILPDLPWQIVSGDLSISHDGDYAFAAAVFLGKEL